MKNIGILGIMNNLQKNTGSRGCLNKNLKPKSMIIDIQMHTMSNNNIRYTQYYTVY